MAAGETPLSDVRFLTVAEVAAVMRLNVQWGFNPVKFTRELEARLADADRSRAPRRIERVSAEPTRQSAVA